MKRRASWPLAAGLLLGACAPWQSEAPVTPSSYSVSREQVPRSVGKLRRLALLHLEQKAPAACRAGTNGEIAIELPDPAEYGLLALKGYELLRPDTGAYAEWLAPPGAEALAQDLHRALAEPGDDVVGGAALALLQRLRSEASADGLLVVERRWSCWHAQPGFRGLLAIGSAGVSELLVDPKLLVLYPAHGAVVLEAASARPVWRNTIAMGSPRGLWADFWRDERPTDAERLLGSIEPAVPKLLTR